MESRAQTVLRGGRRQSRECTSKKVGRLTAGGMWNFSSDFFSCLSETRNEAIKQSGKFEDWGAGLGIGRKEGKRSRKIKVNRLGKFSRATKEPEVLP